MKKDRSLCGPATGCRTADLEEAVGANLGKGSDDWSLLRAHAPAWAASLLREIGKEGLGERMERSESPGEGQAAAVAFLVAPAPGPRNR